MFTFSVLDQWIGTCVALALIGNPASQDSEDQERLESYFTDLTTTCLRGVTTVCGSPAKDYILEVNGGGLGLEDIDADGDLDLLVVDGSTVDALRRHEPGRPARWFFNDGGGRFEPAGDGWALEPTPTKHSWGTGCAISDVNADGATDVVILGVGADQLFLGKPDGGFEKGRELPAPTTAPDTATDAMLPLSWSTSATFLDYDSDGALDLFIVRYLVPPIAPADAHAARWKGHAVMRGPQGLTPVADQLLRGRGDGSFEDVTEESGIAAATPSYGLGVVTLDYDADGRTDLFVSNDSTANHLWRNRGDGTFEEVGLRAGVSHNANGRAQASMGIATGDVDGDGREELFVTNFSGEPNTLYFGRSGSSFRDRTNRSGLTSPSLHMLGWGTGLQDVDGDGDLDLWVLNGHVYPEATRAGTDTAYAQVDQLFVQGANRRFDARPLTTGAPSVSRAGVQGDLDRDGDLDIVTMTLDGPVRVLRNDTSRHPRGRWLGVRLVGNSGNAQGLGARVDVRVDDQELSRVVRGSAGFQAAAPAEVHFTWQGRPATESSDSKVKAPAVTVHWPDGHVQEVSAVPDGQWATIRREEDDK